MRVSTSPHTVSILAVIVVGIVLSGSPAVAEPAILIPSLPDREVLRYDGDTGDFVGVHVPRGTMLDVNGISVGPDGNLYVASPPTDAVFRFDLETGAFIDVFVAPGAGGLVAPSHWAINWPGPNADGHLYVTSGPHDSIMRFKGPVPVLPPELDPCADVENPGDPCPGTSGEGGAILVPGGTPVPNPLKPFWDEEGDLYASYVDLPAILRFDSATGEAKPGPLGAPGTAEFVPPGEFGDVVLGNAVLGPDGNIYVVIAICDGNPAGTVARFAGPTPGGDCIDLVPGSACPGPLADLEADPDSAVFAPGDCIIFGAAFGTHGNIWVLDLFGNRVLRYAGPLPDGEDTRGACASLVPGSPCPGPLGNPGTAQFIPPGLGGLELPYDILFVDLPPVTPCVPPNDDCPQAIPLPEDPWQVIPYNSTCATTDGPDIPGSGCARVSLDLWYSFVPPIDGDLEVSLVDSVPCYPNGCAWDTVLAVYGGGESCVCPVDNSELIACNDDFDQGAGPSQVTIAAQAGMCYTIRVGGYLNDYGAAELSLELGDCIGCDDGNVCTIDTCDTVTGCINDGTGVAGACDDGNANTINDACQGDAAGTCQGVAASLVETGEPARTNRYLRFSAPSPQIAGGLAPEVIRARCVSLDGFPSPPTDTLYLGPPFQAPEEDSSQPGLTFTVAPLQCDPHGHNWSAEGIVSAYGAELMPGSTYEVQRASTNCTDMLTNEACWSEPLTITTGKYGDVWPLFDDPANPPQPDFNDIAAVVRKFLGAGAANAPIKAVAQLQPNCVFPDRSIDFKDIAADVQAFLGTPYAASHAGPCACPSTVTCGVTPCANDLGCVGAGDGLCVDGFCTDPCGRCTP